MIKTRVCKYCGKRKKLELFTNSKQCRFGKTYKCSKCTRLAVKIYRETFPEKVKALKRKQYLAKKHDPVYRKRTLEHVHKYRERHPDRVQANLKKQRAKRSNLYHSSEEVRKESSRYSQAYYREHRKEIRRNVSIAQKEKIDEMSDSYIRSLIRKETELRSADVPSNLVELKRKQLKLKRQYGKLKSAA